MTEREKIIDVLNKNFTQDVECTPIYTTAQGKEVALPQELCDILYKHRAEVAERALKIAEDLGELCAPVEDYINQAEKELVEEKE